MEEKIYSFECKINKKIFSKDDYAIYDCEINKNKPSDVALDKITLVGYIPNLLENNQYKVKAKEIYHKKYGMQYQIVSVLIEKPTNIETSKQFLLGLKIGGERVVDSLLTTYPTIIDKIINNDLSDVDLNNVKYVKDSTMDKIKDGVISNFKLIGLVDFFQGLISMNYIKKIYDKYQSVEMLKYKMKNNPYSCLCNISGIGFISADMILLKLEKTFKDKGIGFTFKESLITSEERMKACISYTLRQNENEGHTKIKRDKLKRKCKKLTPECIDLFNNVIDKYKNSIFEDKIGGTISLLNTFKTELAISCILKEMLKNSHEYHINTELYRIDKEGLSITNEQLNSLDNVCKHNVSILTAPAGSGKTASIKNMLNMLEDNNKRFLLCSPTGKASEVMQQQTGRDAKTIHRTLGYNPSSKEWTYNKHNKLPVDVVIVDEFSMTDIFLFLRLLDAIDVRQTKIVLVFDSYQASSVGCGNIAQDLLTSKVFPTTILTKIFRYDEGGQMQVATKIRNGQSFLPTSFQGVKILGTKKDFIYDETSQSLLISEVAKIYKKILNDGYTIDDVAILSAQNVGEYGTININNHIQSMIQKNKNNPCIERGDVKFYLGDKVIQISNNYKAIIPHDMVELLYPNWSKNHTEEDDEMPTEEIYNGNSGTIIKVDSNGLTVRYINGKYIYYPKNNLNEIELGYCISFHKVQGSSINQVIAIAPKSHTYMLNSNLLYVATTRARKRTYLIGNIKTINRAIKIKENLQRDTYLVDMLNDKYIDNLDLLQSTTPSNN